MRVDKKAPNQSLEKMGKLYDKLKGSIFLKLAVGWQVSGEVKKRIYPLDIWGEPDYEITTNGATVELKNDMTFAEFCNKWGIAQ